MDDIRDNPDSEKLITEDGVDERPDPGGSERKKRGVLKYLLILVIVFLAVPYAYTSNPKSCTLCHGMEKYYKSWRKSSHSVAVKNCFGCHVKQGAVSLWIYRISFYREIYASMAGVELKPAGATVPGIDSCQRSGCHSLNRENSASGDIKINHRMHTTKVDIACIKCHPGAAHPEVGDIGELTPHRKLCFECHLSRKNDCGFCHNKRFSDARSYDH
ncbi:MAG: NapC/NirT family cytochrome c [Actinobacteria bacterium]|nr:NapC/NirT family cytochrome c [Actinomycetota bacterium]